MWLWWFGRPQVENERPKDGERPEPPWEIVGKAFVTICQDCGGETYGSHTIYSTTCRWCGSSNVKVKTSDKDVYGYSQ
jgi:ribosomal protein L40E